MEGKQLAFRAGAKAITTKAEGRATIAHMLDIAQDRVYADVVVPPRATAVPTDTAESAPTQRDRHLRHITAHGRRGWQRASGYIKRARAEAAISRFKRVFGDALRSRTDERRATEVEVAVHALGRMLELGRPNYARTA